LEEKLKDPLPFIRKNILILFLNLFSRSPDNEKEVFLKINEF